MIDHDVFVNWAKERFEKIVVHKDEVQVPDVWWKNEYGETDSKNKCWVNTTKGCFHAFKSGKKGGVIALVVEVDRCSWEEAAETLELRYSPQDFEKKLEEMFKAEAEVEKKEQVKLPLYTYLISALSLNNQNRIAAENYLKPRKIPVDGLYICVNGIYRNRIIIPYYDRNNSLIYWNGRDITGKAPAKYRGPDKEDFNVGKSDVIWMQRWPLQNERIFVTEGEIDAMSICLSGLNGGACGSKNVGPKQIEMLRGYKITFSFDNDKAGEDWLPIAEEMMQIGFKDMTFVRPPQGFKDWNVLLQKHNENVLKHWILKEQTPINHNTLAKLKLDNL